MTSTKKSYDQDDRSIDTVNTNRSNNSEFYLARIQEETNRLRQKRKERRDSADSSTGSSKRNSAASATSFDPEQEFFLAHLNDDDNREHEHETKPSTASSHPKKSSSTTRNSSQASSQTQATTSLISSSFESKLSTTPAQNHWNETFDSSERSHHSLDSDSHEKANTTHVSVSPRSARSIILTQTVAEEQEEDEEKTDSEWEDPSEFLVIQRGDSIAENNQFEDPVISSTTTRSSSSTSKLNFPFSALSPRKKPNMAEELERKKDDDFQKTLIDEVLGKDDGDKVSMEKVMMIIWQFREDKDVIKFMTRFVTKVSS